MNLKYVKMVLILASLAGFVATMWVGLLAKPTELGKEEAVALVFFLFGVGMASVAYSLLLDHAYMVQAFRLHGWGDGKYAVYLRVHEQGYLTAHDDNRIFPASDNLPTAPRWTPVKGSSTEVVVCDQFYRKTFG